MKALITGGAGFIGSHLAQTLIEQGHQVTILDNFSTGRKQNIANLPIKIIKGDICDLATVKKAMANCDIVFHQAALVSVPQSIKEPEINHRINVTGSFNIFEAARQQGVKRIVYASSAAVYGNHSELPKTETSPIHLKSPYATAKYMSEHYAHTYAELYGITCVGLRYMNVYGPRQDPSSPYSGVLSIFCRNCITNKPTTVFGDGEQTRDFVYVQDVVQANISAATMPLAKRSEVFNIGRGEPTSLNQIITELNQLGGKPITVSYQAERVGDIKHSYADITKARTQLRYEPKIDLGQGLKHTLSWFRTHKNT